MKGRWMFCRAYEIIEIFFSKGTVPKRKFVRERERE